jgi:heterodisulfide reductase subunit A-like polyferredoxin
VAAPTHECPERRVRLPDASLEEAQRLRPVLDATPATAEVTVVGAGPTGIETPSETRADGIMAIRVENARITGLYYVRNPEKLSRVESETPLTLR